MSEKPLVQVLKTLVEAISEIENDPTRAVCLSVQAARLAVLQLHALVGKSTFKLRDESTIFLTRLLKNFEECVTLMENTTSFQGVSTKNHTLIFSRIAAQYADFILDMLLDQYDSSTRQRSRLEVSLQSFKLAKCIIKGARIVLEYESQKANSDLEAFKRELMSTYKDYMRSYPP